MILNKFIKAALQSSLTCFISYLLLSFISYEFVKLSGLTIRFYIVIWFILTLVFFGKKLEK